MHSNLEKGFITGSAAVVEQVLLGNMMDMIKIEKQRSIYKTYPTIIRQFCNKSVNKGLFIGLWPWGIMMYSTRGIGFGFAQSYSKSHLSTTNLDSYRVNIYSGIIGGIFEGIMTTPFSLMRTRIAQKGKANFDIRGVLKGIPINSLKRGTDWGLRTIIYCELNKSIDNPFFNAFISGIVSSTITTPIDRLLPIIQQENPPKDIVKYVKNAGLKNVFSGNFARIIHGGWHTCFIFGALHIFGQSEVMKY